MGPQRAWLTRWAQGLGVHPAARSGVLAGVLLWHQLSETPHGLDGLLRLLDLLELLDTDDGEESDNQQHRQEDDEERQPAGEERVQHLSDGEEQEEGAVGQDDSGGAEEAHTDACALRGASDFRLGEFDLGADQGGSLHGGVTNEVTDAAAASRVRVNIGQWNRVDLRVKAIPIGEHAFVIVLAHGVSSSVCAGNFLVAGCCFTDASVKPRLLARGLQPKLRDYSARCGPSLGLKGYLRLRIEVFHRIAGENWGLITFSTSGRRHGLPPGCCDGILQRMSENRRSRRLAQTPEHRVAPVIVDVDDPDLRQDMLHVVDLTGRVGVSAPEGARQREALAHAIAALPAAWGYAGFLVTNKESEFATLPALVTVDLRRAPTPQWTVLDVASLIGARDRRAIVITGAVGGAGCSLLAGAVASAAAETWADDVVLWSTASSDLPLILGADTWEVAGGVGRVIVSDDEGEGLEGADSAGSLLERLVPAAGGIATIIIDAGHHNTLPPDIHRLGEDFGAVHHVIVTQQSVPGVSALRRLCEGKHAHTDPQLVLAQTSQRFFSVRHAQMLLGAEVDHCIAWDRACGDVVDSGRGAQWVRTGPLAATAAAIVTAITTREASGRRAVHAVLGVEQHAA